MQPAALIKEEGEGPPGFIPNIKIAGLEKTLREERHGYELLQSEFKYHKFSTSQEIDKCRRECRSLRETVARLEVECHVVRVREAEMHDENEKKGAEFKNIFVELSAKNRDLGTSYSRALDEIQVLKDKLAAEEHLRVAWFEKKKKEMKERTGALETENSKLKVKAGETERRENELKNRVAKLETQNSGLKKAEADSFYWKQKCATLEAELENSNVSELQMRGAELEEKLAKLETQYKDLESAKEEAEKRHEALEIEILEWQRKCQGYYNLSRSNTQTQVEVGSTRTDEILSPQETSEDSMTTRIPERYSHPLSCCWGAKRRRPRFSSGAAGDFSAAVHNVQKVC